MKLQNFEDILQELTDKVMSYEANLNTYDTQVYLLSMTMASVNWLSMWVAAG